MRWAIVVLHGDDVCGGRVDPIAPENVAGSDVEQLRRHAETFARVNEAGGQNRVDTQLLTNLARIDLLALVLRNHGRRPHDERAHAREFGDHRIGKRKLVKARGRIVAQISEARIARLFFS